MTKSPTKMKSFGQLSTALRRYWTELENDANRDLLGLKRYADDRADAFSIPFGPTARRD